LLFLAPETSCQSLLD